MGNMSVSDAIYCTKCHGNEDKGDPPKREGLGSRFGGSLRSVPLYRRGAEQGTAHHLRFVVIRPLEKSLQNASDEREQTANLFLAPFIRDSTNEEGTA